MLFDGTGLPKILMFIGLGIFCLGGMLWLFGGIFNLGKLPGDFSWQKGNMSFHFPLATSLLLSLILTILLNLFFRR